MRTSASAHGILTGYLHSYTRYAGLDISPDFILIRFHILLTAITAIEDCASTHFFHPFLVVRCYDSGCLDFRFGTQTPAIYLLFQHLGIFAVMHFKTAATAALFSALAIAGPLDERAAGEAFTVEQVAVEQEVLPPSAQVLRTYAKYMKTPPAKIVVAAKAALQSGSVVANPQNYDLAYLSRVTVGGQTFTLNFDTGSADLWVYSTLQPSSQTSGRTLYDPTESNNASIMSSQSWAITYGDGSGASGKVYADNVVIGGVTATSQAVEAATSVSQQFLNDKESGGLVGLAFSNINTVRPNQQATFFDSVSRTLPSKLFTADLKKGAPGSYDFGFIDTSKYAGAITYAPIQSSSGFWRFAMGGYTIGGKAAKTSSMGTGIADTGTTLLYLPDAVVSDYWGSVSGAYMSNQFGAYIFPCASTLPTFAISISGRNFVIVSLAFLLFE